jgi:hypothetical protein
LYLGVTPLTIAVTTAISEMGAAWLRSASDVYQIM